LLRVELDIVRLSSVYGPFEYESGDRDVMSPHLQMLRAAIDGVSLGLSRALRADWIYSRDVAAAILRASEHDGLGGQTFNIDGDVITDLFGWGALLAERFTNWHFGVCAPGQTAKVVYRNERETAPLNISRFAKAAGFRPAFDQPRAAADFMGCSIDTGRCRNPIALGEKPSLDKRAVRRRVMGPRVRRDVAASTDPHAPVSSEAIEKRL
jgi:nucleoside-diphosphate-sugar epimerase